mmetsp:Transcript_37348/g.81901  ORF Transcript_37348/g.81901 Transcript_37348/m.81901 type:complete len:232 (-) Transcript_37348:803-1498(-)
MRPPAPAYLKQCAKLRTACRHLRQRLSPVRYVPLVRLVYCQDLLADLPGANSRLHRSGHCSFLLAADRSLCLVAPSLELQRQSGCRRSAAAARERQSQRKHFHGCFRVGVAAFQRCDCPHLIGAAALQSVDCSDCSDRCCDEAKASILMRLRAKNYRQPPLRRASPLPASARACRRVHASSEPTGQACRDSTCRCVSRTELQKPPRASARCPSSHPRPPTSRPTCRPRKWS